MPSPIFLLLAAAAAAPSKEPATPSGHFILLATQRTGTSWVMSELARRSSCIATASELFLDDDHHKSRARSKDAKDFKWTRSRRVRCLKTLYGEQIDKQKQPHRCSEKFKRWRPAWKSTRSRVDDVRRHAIE